MPPTTTSSLQALEPSGLAPRALELNAELAAANSYVAGALSPIGRAVFYPKDIPFQAAEARSAEFNATIGQITDGAGSILSVSSIADAIHLAPTIKNRALLYSPIGGHPDVRAAWHEYQTPAELRTEEGPPCGLPLVTVGLTHAISLIADLFGGPGRHVVVPDPCWGNYSQIFGLRGGSIVHRAPSYQDGVWSWHGLQRTFDSIEGDTPIVVVLNLPSNPGGYSPSVAERVELADILVAAAQRRTVVVLCDDAYTGLVFDDAFPSQSMFWELLGRHPALIPLRGAGSTKEFLLFGGRVGFVTLPFAADSVEYRVLEDKLFSLIRSSVGSPVSVSQMLLLEGLNSGQTAIEISAIRARLRGRFEVMQQALASAEGHGETFRVMPCNSGAFMLLELLGSTDPEAVRQRLLNEFSTGVVAIRPRYIRLAFCSMSRQAIPELVQRVAAVLRPVKSAAQPI